MQVTAEEFSSTRHELPDGGRWTELVEGRPVVLDPPDEIYGTIVLNLSKAIGTAMRADRSIDAAPCFDLGIQTLHDPDTIRFPAAVAFRGGDRFGEVGEVIADRVPEVAIEIAADPQRRLHCAERILEYHDAGVGAVWVIDPHEQALTIAPREGLPAIYREDDPLVPLIDLELAVTIEDLFAIPKWYR
ncbi:Uma2 family endonuclease [Stratiformator vulcanicus]|uniref:Putative restriction endonuclease domain-containing protein n=1 Tax=Stratiformator vulcanicus TaxID=2527980 RepID=A0A517R6C4_9PLAN|nr:Uma2 family endonuclease [Stratiformator vulcanicus]QDT39395.1 hypothetical protein Pan189_38020 [Stratiformator vulcanicus]